MGASREVGPIGPSEERQVSCDDPASHLSHLTLLHFPLVRLFYDLVLLGFRAALLLPLLAFRSGFVQAMVMLAATGLYYFYYRGNSPFIKFEDQGDLEHPNLHYRAEESKVCGGLSR